MAKKLTYHAVDVAKDPTTSVRKSVHSVGTQVQHLENTTGPQSFSLDVQENLNEAQETTERLCEKTIKLHFPIENSVFGLELVESSYYQSVEDKY